MKTPLPAIITAFLFCYACAPADGATDRATDGATDASEAVADVVTQAAENPDQREVITLTPAQRDHVLTGMRQFLSSTHGVIDGVVNDDMALVAESAALSGHRDRPRNGLRMGQVLPEGFRAMGSQTHQAFSELADMAENGADKEEILEKLSTTMHTCTACHATYQIKMSQ